MLALTPAAEPVVQTRFDAARIHARRAEAAFAQCMNSQANTNDDATGGGRANAAAVTFCRPALETMLTAQEDLIDASDLSDTQKREARRNLRTSLRALRDEVLWPNRAPRD
jgi:hypothetical protein